MAQSRYLNHAYLIPLLLFLALIADGVLMQQLAPQFLSSNYTLTPRLLLLILVTSTYFFPKQPLFFYALLFGLFYDSYYVGIIGPYAATLGAIVYVQKQLQGYLDEREYAPAILFLAALLLLEIIIYAIYSVLGIGTGTLGAFLLSRLLPTVLLNAVLMGILYFPLYRLSQWMYD